jgi:general secretion pathway protein C
MGVDAIAKRLSPFVILAMIAVIAYFQARGMTQLVSTVVLGGAPVRRALPHATRSVPTTDPFHETSAAVILARNPFDSVTGPLHEVVPEPVSPGDGDAHLAQDPYADPPCGGARALLIVSSGDPSWSFAAIAGADGKTTLVRRGEEIGGAKVHFIGDLREQEHVHEGEGGVWDRVWLTHGSMRCQMELGAKTPMTGARPRDTSPRVSSTDYRIRKIGENRFEVDRSTVESVVANPAELMKARIFPVRDGSGRVVGMRLLGLKPGSLLGSLGLVNGDQLMSINGFEMNDPKTMLEAYTKLMQADRLSLSLIRQGRPMNIDLAIK